jgi:predicted RecA/RadA family phage recombinase
MPTATFIHDGNSIDYTPGSNIAAGDVVVLMDLVGVAKRDIPANTTGSLAVTGVFDVPKAVGPGLYFDVGQLVYWDATAKKAINTGGGPNKYMGKAVRGAGMGDTTVRIRLGQQ